MTERLLFQQNIWLMKSVRGMTKLTEALITGLKLDKIEVGKLDTSGLTDAFSNFSVELKDALPKTVGEGVKEIFTPLQKTINNGVRAIVESILDKNTTIEGALRYLGGAMTKNPAAKDDLLIKAQDNYRIALEEATEGGFFDEIKKLKEEGVAPFIEELQDIKDEEYQTAADAGLSEMVSNVIISQNNLARGADYDELEKKKAVMPSEFGMSGWVSALGGAKSGKDVPKSFMNLKPITTLANAMGKVNVGGGISNLNDLSSGVIPFQTGPKQIPELPELPTTMVEKGTKAMKGFGKQLGTNVAGMGIMTQVASALTDPLQAFISGVLAPFAILGDVLGMMGEMLGMLFMPLIMKVVEVLMSFMPIIDMLIDVLSPIIDLFVAMLDPLIDMAAIMMDYLSMFFPPIMDLIIALLAPLMSMIPVLFSLFELSMIFMPIVLILVNTILPLFTEYLTFISQGFEMLADWMDKLDIHGFMEGLMDWSRTVVDDIRYFFANLNLAEKLWEWIKDQFGW